MAASPSPGNDNSQPSQGGNLVADLVMALRFYSRLPAGRSAHEVPDLNRIAMALPFASLVIGIGPAVLLLVLAVSGVPPLFAALAAAAMFAIVTGAMSEDAAADAADGLFGGATPERRLEILKDSRHGTYGVLTVVFVVGLKVAALSAIVARNPLAAASVWMAATMLARSGSLYVSLRLAPARGTGTAASVGRLSRNGFILGIVFASIIALVLAAPFTGLLGLAVALAFGALVVIGWTLLCERLVGGLTGDLIGAAQALLEIAILAVFMRLIV
ncbi:adenosylcobinamide-GDP ribazoletransferase [Pelagibacterium limicola]|uniref:adenosylcobinamide-GDP ribazoletransferase n=1 Tax=Pelagibacterium limicola TaxID=2791022 RepID=UPI0018AFC05B|nr:adenosylcobinamide-GDP ribazoletransferase [Pelagibacterium limicola]